ncbi:hypothetical protein MAHJHV47_45050 [Mycobacterium avium subsp. hominissuis]
MVSYRGNRYSVPPELAAANVVVSHPVGGQSVSGDHDPAHGGDVAELPADRM